MKRSCFILCTLLLAALMNMPYFAKGQQTGSFDDQILFKGSQRTLSFYVPPDYDSTSQYRLIIGLHGLGDNSNNFRNALVNSLNWGTHFPNTIIVCPDGGSDRNSDFYSPSGDEEIIPRTLQYTNKHYRIDSSRVILEGFSLGGRSALKYGLEHHKTFQGLILNTPAVQGIADVTNDPDASLLYAYQNASKLPVYITNGRNDQTYLNFIDTLYDQLILEDGIVLKNTIDGMGHTIPPFQYMDSVLYFLEHPAFFSKDLELVRARAPQRGCIEPFNIKCLLRNTGSDTIRSFTLEYVWQGNTRNYQWKGQLSSYQHVEVTLPAINPASAVKDTLPVKITTLNATVKDSIKSNNKRSVPVQVVEQGGSPPVKEGFEGGRIPPEGWILERSGSLISWSADDQTSRDGNYSMVCLNTILLFYNTGARENLLSPVADLSSTEHPHVAFDLAYNYHRYIPPVVTQEMDFADTLEIAVSTDCGETFEVLFKKGGNELKTFDDPIENGLRIEQLLLNPSEKNWKSISVDLTDYAGKEKVIVRFSYISAQGGTINIDNVAIEENQNFSLPGSGRENSFTVYPNPASHKVNINIRNDHLKHIELFNATGQKVTIRYFTKNKHHVTLDTRELKNGMYYLNVITEKGIQRKKVLINK